MKINRFEDLNVWKSSVGLTKTIYDLTAKEKFSRDFGLRDQIRRAVVSISSNIVEGFERSSNNEFIRFLKIAKGSAGEVRNQLHIAYAVGYMTEKEFDEVYEEVELLTKQIGAFVNYLESKRLSGEFVRK